MGDKLCGPASETSEVLAACVRGDGSARVELMVRAQGLIPVLRDGLPMTTETVLEVLKRAFHPDVLMALQMNGASQWSADELLVVSVIREAQRRDAGPSPEPAAAAGVEKKTPALWSAEFMPRIAFLLYYWCDMAVARIAAVLGRTPAEISAYCDRLFDQLDYHEEIITSAPRLVTDERVRLHGLACTPSPGFQGRKRELAVLQAEWEGTLHDRGSGALEIVAGAGMGKTGLVLHWLAQLMRAPEEDRPRLTFGWCFGGPNGRGRTGWDAFVAALRAALPRGSVGPSTEALARGIAATPMLIILDGCTDDAVLEAECARLLAALRDQPRPWRSLCIVLGERLLASPRGAVLRLAPLTAGASARLLRQGFRIGDSEEFLRELGVALGGNPAALCALGEYARAHRLNSLLGDEHFPASHRVALRAASERERARAAMARPSDVQVSPVGGSQVYLITCVPEPSLRTIHPKIVDQLRQHLSSGRWYTYEDRTGANAGQALTANAIVVLFCLDIAADHPRCQQVLELAAAHKARMLLLTVDPMVPGEVLATIDAMNPRPLSLLGAAQRDLAFVKMCRLLEQFRA